MKIYKVIGSMENELRIWEHEWKLLEEKISYYKIDSGETKIHLKKADLNKLTKTLNNLDLSYQVYCTEERLLEFKEKLPTVIKNELEKMAREIQEKLNKLALK